MCNFLSGVVTAERHPRVLCVDLHHHDATVDYFRLEPETYREWEWTREDSGESLDVRAAPGENPSVLKSAILAKYPSRLDCLNECIQQIAEHGGSLYLSSIESADGLVLPKTITGNLAIRCLQFATGVPFPELIGGALDLHSLKSAANLTLPESIGGSLNLSSLESADGLTLPKWVGGSLNLASLRSADGLVFPKWVGDTLHLESLESADGLVLPEAIGGRVFLPLRVRAELEAREVN